MSKPILQLLSESQQSVDYMVGEITHICRNMKKRPPGSEGEREAAEYMAEILKTECKCQDVSVESFTEHPAAFYGYFWFSMVLNLFSAVGFFVHHIISIVSGILSLLLFFFQFILYKQIIDPLFPEKTGTNVTAVHNCEREVKRRVFINGHIDAAWEFPLNYYFGGVAFEIPGALSVLGVLFYIVIGVSTLCGGEEWTEKAAMWGLLFIPFFVAVGFTYNPSRVADGANDNLTGCFIGIALLRELEKQGVSLEHTEVGVILTGSEEAGLRGAKAWCKTHAKDYLDVPTYIIAFDTIHDPNQLMVNVRDLNGTMASDAGLCGVFIQAALKINVPCKRGHVPIFGGGTDSAAFTQGGFRSAGITGLSHKLEDYYHTRRDTWNNLNKEGLENCYKATVQMLWDIDHGKLD